MKNILLLLPLALTFSIQGALVNFHEDVSWRLAFKQRCEELKKDQKKIQELDADKQKALQRIMPDITTKDIGCFLDEVLLLGQDEKNKLLVISEGYGLISVAEALLDHGVDVNYSNKNKNTVLIRAAQEGHIDVVKMFLDHGADVNHINKSRDTALILAAKSGHTSIVELLLQYGADVYHVDQYGYTVLIWAAQEGRKAIVELLLQRGIGDDRINKDKNTALIKAAQKGRIGVIKVLLNHGADVNYIDRYGYTVRNFACYPAIIRLLNENSSTAL